MLQTQKQAIRLRRAVLANVGTIINAVLCVFGAQLGYFEISTTEVLLLTGMIWLGHLVFVLLIATNLNLRFPCKDLSFTVPQMVWVTISVSLMLLFCDTLRPSMMMAYLLVMVFGAFYLSLRGFIFFTLFLLSCYLLAMVQVAQMRPDNVDWNRELVILVGFLCVVVGCAFVGVEISNLRRTLMGRNRDLKAANSRIEELAITDDLTGLYNRRHLMNILQQQRAMANRGQYRFVLCYIDMDHFKKVNDIHGHVIGDRALEAFATVARESLREVDIAARLGGEEFVLVLADTSLVSAQKICTRIAARLASIKLAPQLTLTMSVGITAYRAVESIDQTLERADKLLYEAKASGRNRIVMDVGSDEENAVLPFSPVEKRA
ncbi:MAG: GGDEF domain-containing protein [Oceanospirillaceae bacterium]|nr:GGDEF domain-containing protein [Oceanospirillaceae bacterium]MCP5335910.1 GGDEF domain-containing protein [Oceanospirillaceae bacterium]MCP5351053.1 GGDEF domain-containing protein [Oceanospirillaceae bacterium]